MADQTPILPTCTTPKRTSAGASMGRNSTSDANADLSPSLRAAASRSRRISATGYLFSLAFLACVAVLASNVSGLSAHNMFRTTTAYSETYRSHFSSVVSRFFPGSLASNSNITSPSPPVNGESFDQNMGRRARASSSIALNPPPQTTPPPLPPPPSKSDEILTLNPLDGAGGERMKSSVSGERRDRARGQREGKRKKVGKRKGKSAKETKQCDLFDGSWVKDESYPLYKAGSCPHLDESFDCHGNGRSDWEYEKYRWQPKNCNVPRLSGKRMLQMMRGKRFVFVGDSLNRNMWESLVCILRNSVQDKNKVYEVSGREEFRSEGSYTFIFQDYNSTVEFYRSPFLVQEWEMAGPDGKKKETLRLDLIERSSDRYKTADFLVFNTGHWWTHEKTSEGKGYYQEGSHVYDHLDVNEAFRRAMTTWARWIDANVNPWKTKVVFRSYSASHFIGGEWNSGGQCDSETEPIRNEKELSEYPPIPLVHVLERTLKMMKTPVLYLNITKLSDYRKDAHPSVHQKQNMTDEEKKSAYQDCSHWCLPGVPDTWNELIYSHLLTQQPRRHRGRTQSRRAESKKLL